MVMVFPCAWFQSEKGFQLDAENLGLGLPCAPNPRACILMIMYKKYKNLVTTESSHNSINVHLGYKPKRFSGPLAC